MNFLSIFYFLSWFIPIFLLIKDFFIPHQFISILFSKTTLHILKFSLYQAVISTFIAFIVSIIPSLYASKKRNFITTFIEMSIFIPFFFPPISAVMGFIGIYGNNGIINRLFGINLDIIHTFFAIIMAHVFYNSPIYVKYISDGLKMIPISLIENAKIDGANKITTFFKIELPLIFPSITKASFIVFAYNFTSFVVILILGGIKYTTFEIAIFASIRSANFLKALVYALLQYFILLLIAIFANFFKSQDLPVNVGIIEKNQNKSFFIFFISLIYLIFEYSIFFMGLSFMFFDYIKGRFDFEKIKYIFSKEMNSTYRVREAMFNSLVISILVAFFVTAIIFFMVRNYREKRENKFFHTLILASLGLSPTFVALALLYVKINFNIFPMIVVILGYFILSFPISYAFLSPIVLSFDIRLIELAKIDGASNLKTIFFIEIPILLPFLLSAFLQIFAIIFGEFTFSYVLQIQDYFPLINIVIYSLFSDRLYREAYILSGLTIIIVFLAYYMSFRYIRMYEKKIT